MNDSSFPLVDTHCHLTWESFDGDRDEVLLRMKAEGVLQAIVVATDANVSRQARDFCRSDPGLFPTAGIHPNDLGEDWKERVQEVAELLAGGEYVAVGETGLDYYRDTVTRERQQAAFEEQAGIAVDRGLPLIVHVRDQEGRSEAFDDVADLIERFDTLEGVMHCYTGSVEHARRYRDAGFYISFSGVLTFKNGGNVREVAAATPKERSLVETDAPFLAPVPWRGDRNEPSFVASTARKLAEVWGVSESEARRVTTENARRLFRLPDAPEF